MTCSSDDCSLSKVIILFPVKIILYSLFKHLAHPKCFEKLEQAAVMALKNVKGRAREWSDKERHRVSNTISGYNNTISERHRVSLLFTWQRLYLWIKGTN